MELVLSLKLEKLENFNKFLTNEIVGDKKIIVRENELLISIPAQRTQVIEIYYLSNSAHFFNIIR